MPRPAKLDFANSQIAFAKQSNEQLRHSYRLFRLMGISPLVKLGPKLCTASLRLGLPVQGLLRATIFKQFCGGESLADCLPTVEALYEGGVSTILDYAVEGGSSDAAKEAAMTELLRSIAFAKQNPAISFAVFKASGLTDPALLAKRDRGESLDATEAQAFASFSERVLRLCTTAADAGVRIFIDAEESWLQNSIDELAFAMMRQFNREQPIVFTTIQLYRRDRFPYLQSLAEQARKAGVKLGLKLVRGAYMKQERAYANARDTPSPIHANKAATDLDFNRAVAFCTKNVDDIAFCIGSHNEDSLLKAAKGLRQAKLSTADKRITFSQLYGMADHMSYNLAAHGFQVSKYLPYGPVAEVLPYLFRRAEENTSIQGQSSRELSLLTQEMRRRGLSTWI